MRPPRSGGNQGFPIPEQADFLSARERSGLEAAIRLKLLSDSVDVAILRDVVERHAVSQVVGLLWMARHRP